VADPNDPRLIVRRVRLPRLNASHVQCNSDHRPRARRLRNSNALKLNALLVRCSNGHKLSVRRLRNSNARRANASHVRPHNQDRSRRRNPNNRVRHKDSKVRREVVHRLSTVVAAKASPVNPINRRHANDTDGDVRSVTIRENPFHPRSRYENLPSSLHL